MSLLKRLRARRPSHTTVVAYLALFLAVGGGSTAVALQGRNTVDSGDIINQQVKSPDVQNGGIRSADVRDDSLAGGGLQGGDILESTLGTVPSAANADTLDGLSSSSFVQTNTNTFVRNTTYVREGAVGAGTDVGDGTFRQDVSCFSGDRMLSGGPANVLGTSDLVESFPADTATWATRIHKNGQTDNFNTVVLCANQP